jgi:hypothetical protein
MKSFQEHLEDAPDTIDEGFLRGASAVVLMNHINNMRKKIKQSRKVDAKTIDALASMILASASLTFAMTQLPPETLKGNQQR